MAEVTEYHRRYLRAINNSTRRTILRQLQDGCQTITALTAATGIEPTLLTWHLDILEHGSCVKKDYQNGDVTYHLTQEGRIVNFLDS